MAIGIACRHVEVAEDRAALKSSAGTSNWKLTQKLRHDMPPRRIWDDYLVSQRPRYRRSKRRGSFESNQQARSRDAYIDGRWKVTRW